MLHHPFIALHHPPPVLHHFLPILHHLQLSPEDAEDYIKYLLSIGKLDEAALKMADIVNDEGFVSKEGKSRYQLWHELCELIAKNPDKVTAGEVGGRERVTVVED